MSILEDRICIYDKPRNRGIIATRAYRLNFENAWWLYQSSILESIKNKNATKIYSLNNGIKGLTKEFPEKEDGKFSNAHMLALHHINTLQHIKKYYKGVVLFDTGDIIFFQGDTNRYYTYYLSVMAVLAAYNYENRHMLHNGIPQQAWPGNSSYEEVLNRRYIRYSPFKIKKATEIHGLYLQERKVKNARK